MTETEVNVFQKMESFDEMQILDPKLRDKLAYSVQGKVELSYAGIKQLILNMSQEGQGMELVSKEVERKHTDNDMRHDVWYASVVLRNKKTGHESWGVSENPVEDNAKYDQFGRTKAVSKAIRNAERQQLPELLIRAFLEKIQGKEGEKVQELTKEKPDDQRDLHNKGKSCDCKVPFMNKEEPRTCMKCGGSG